MRDENRADRPRSRYVLAGLLMSMGAMHFALPGPFMRIAPPILGAPRFWTYASGAAELASGGLLLRRQTKHLGSWAAAATIAGVYPANIWMAMDAGAPDNPRALAVWLRLPAQIPLLVWALSHRHPSRARRRRTVCSRGAPSGACHFHPFMRPREAADQGHRRGEEARP